MHTTTRAFPQGLRIRSHRQSVWLIVAVLIASGLLLGTAFSGASGGALATALAVLLAVSAAVYRPALGLALLAFTYPIDLTTQAGPLKLTTSMALIGILVLVWFMQQVAGTHRPWRTTTVDTPVLLFVGATALSLVGSNGHMQDQLVGLLKALGGFLVFFLATQSIRERSEVWLVLGAALAIGTVQAGDTVADLLGSNQNLSELMRMRGMLVQPNLFAGYLVLLIPLLAAIGVAFRRPWASAMVVIPTLLFVVALVATLSRSGWLGLLAGALLLAWLLPERRWRIAAIAGMVGAVLLVAGLTAPIGARLVAPAVGPWEMLAPRWNVWMEAVSMTVHHPLFGVGVANFQHFYPGYGGDPSGLNHAHNLFLNIAAERGLPGLATFSAVLVTLFQALMGALRDADQLVDRALMVGLMASFTAYLVHSLFEVSYYDYKVLLLFWLLLGIAAALPRVFARPPEEAAIAAHEAPNLSSRGGG